MAEVGQRLGSGAYRLSALRNSQGRPVRTGEGPGTLLVSCTLTDSRIKEETTENGGERVSKSKTTGHRSKKLPCVRRVHHGPPLDLVPSPKTLHLSARLPPLMQEKLLLRRMVLTSWTRGAVSVHPDTFRSPQQLRAFCTVVFILAEQGSGLGLRLRGLHLHPDPLQGSTAVRGYSWRRDSSSSDGPPLYRSRTSYYDILKVSPSATQAQIKTAYYKQSFIYHPDKNPGNAEATQIFSEISEAYTVLGSISLRRKYDRGILSQSDLQGAGRPSSKDTSSRSSGSPHHHHHHQQQQQQHRGRQFSQGGEKTRFDFDAFYQAHYGQQLQREQDIRAMKQRMAEMQKEKAVRWKKQSRLEMTVIVMLAMAGALVFSIIKD